MLQVHNLDKHYGGRDLFQKLSWQVQPGERIGLVGPNGAGKTTLLRLIVGAEAADGGTVSLGRDETLGYLPQEAPRATDGTILGRVLEAAVEVRTIGERLAVVEEEMGHATPEAAQVLAEEYAELSDRFRVLDGYTLEARAREVLVGLGFKPEALDGPVTTLSGGWWMRVELARLLLIRPDYLLLDEPTNHLDNESLAFLENFLERYPGAWVVVSHDRYFLNRRVTRIAELTVEGLVSFPGNYDDFVEAREELALRLEATARNQQRKRDELQGFVDRFGAKASKARQAQSRVKQLEKLGTAPPPARKPKTLRFKLPQPRRSGEWLVRLEGVHKQYGEKIIYHGLDLEVRRGDRLALVGVNGAGKSTLLKLLAGTVQANEGKRVEGHNVDVYYFAQHQLDILDAGKNVLEEMESGMPPLTPMTRIRGILGAFLFSQDSVEKSVSVLSGGEKSRLVLAKMLGSPANLLLLDEPTNHLDLASRDMLESALAHFEGTIVFISHDRYFVNTIATKIVDVQPGGSVHIYPGNFDAYTWRMQQQAQEQEAQNKQPTKAASAPKAAMPKAHAAPAALDPLDTRSHAERKADRREEAKRRKAQQTLEDAIAAAETRLKSIDGLLCDPDVYADGPRSAALMSERDDLDANLASKMAEWEALGLDS